MTGDITAFNDSCWTRAITSRAKRKMILVASRSIFSVFSPDEEVFVNSQLWKNLLLKTCTTPLWSGERLGTRVAAWGGREAIDVTNLS